MRIGVDIGGTSIEAVVLDGAGTVVSRGRRPTLRGEEAVIAETTAAVHGVLERAGARPEEVSGLGVGVPGAVDAGKGYIEHAVNLGVTSLDLGPRLRAALGMPVFVENDVNAAALGAFHLRGSGPDGSIALLNLGTGLAGGIVLAGRLWRGRRGVAGEIGHVPLGTSTRRCGCGQTGCLETVCSGSAVERLWPSGDVPAPVALFEAADRGDGRAVEVRREVCEGIAAAIQIIILSTDVDVVVIGGGLSRLGEPLLEQVRVVQREAAAVSPFIASLDLPDRIETAPPDSGLVGAALLGPATAPDPV